MRKTRFKYLNVGFVVVVVQITTTQKSRIKFSNVVVFIIKRSTLTTRTFGIKCHKAMDLVSYFSIIIVVVAWFVIDNVEEEEEVTVSVCKCVCFKSNYVHALALKTTQQITFINRKKEKKIRIFFQIFSETTYKQTQTDRQTNRRTD